MVQFFLLKYSISDQHSCSKNLFGSGDSSLSSTVLGLPYMTYLNLMQEKKAAIMQVHIKFVVGFKDSQYVQSFEIPEILRIP